MSVPRQHHPYVVPIIAQSKRGAQRHDVRAIPVVRRMQEEDSLSPTNVASEHARSLSGQDRVRLARALTGRGVVVA